MNELEQLANEIIESAPEALRDRLRNVYTGGQQTGWAIINALAAWAESEELQTAEPNPPAPETPKSEREPDN